MHIRVAITGLGMTNSLGGDVPTVWRRLIAGENGIRRITLFDPREYRCTVAAQLCTQELGWTMLGRDSYDCPPPLPHLAVRDSRRGVDLFVRCVGEAVESS